jgi:hypothetical protein
VKSFKSIVSTQIIIASLVTVGSALGDVPCVVHAEPPRDVPITYDRRATAHVKVIVEPSGRVSHARTEKPRPQFVSELAEEAARRWLFCGSALPVQRTFILTFHFDGIRPTDLPSHQLVTAGESPLDIHVLHLESAVSHRPPDANPICLIHQVPMYVEVVPIAYGLPDFSARSVQVRHALETIFPNAMVYVLGGCSIQPERMTEIYVCPICLAKRQDWFRHHRGYENLE